MATAHVAATTPVRAMHSTRAPSVSRRAVQVQIATATVMARATRSTTSVSAPTGLGLTAASLFVPVRRNATVVDYAAVQLILQRATTVPLDGLAMIVILPVYMALLSTTHVFVNQAGQDLVVI